MQFDSEHKRENIHIKWHYLHEYGDITATQ